MNLQRIASLALTLILATGLAACGGGSGEGDGAPLSDLDFSGDGGDPANQAPSVTIFNGASSTSISEIWVYDAYAATLQVLPVTLPAGRATRITGLNASQYDFYVIFANGHRSDAAVTTATDPYNGQELIRRLPRVNPGEIAYVDFSY